MIGNFALGLLSGYVGHQTEPLVRAKFGNGWRQMISYVIGVLITFPTAIAMFKNLEDVQDVRKRFILSWFTSFFSVGLGTLAGWIFFSGNHDE
jgi:Na+/H+-dicarboxylate symporter